MTNNCENRQYREGAFILTYVVKRNRGSDVIDSEFPADEAK